MKEIEDEEKKLKNSIDNTDELTLKRLLDTLSLKPPCVWWSEVPDNAHDRTIYLT